MARGLFPFPLAAYQIGGAPKQEPPKQGGTQQVGSRRGFMGAFQRKSLPRTLQVIGATLRDIGNPNSQALDQFAADEMRQRAIDMAERAQERTAQQEKTQQGYLDQAVSSLDESLQPWARIAPEAVARGMFGAAQERWSEPYNLNGATVQQNLVTGEVRQAVPRAPVGRSASTGSPELPPGFVWAE